jgi:predicted nucleic acid-binding protein
MAVGYFDSSALVKLVVEEAGSETAARLWDACDVVVSSRLSYAEVCAALGAARRNRDLRPAAFEAAAADWEEFWAGIRPVELTPAVEKLAGDLAVELALRGADAVHLASALAVDAPNVVLAVWDRRLHAAALAKRLVVAPREIEPHA